LLQLPGVRGQRSLCISFGRRASRTHLLSTSLGRPDRVSESEPSVCFTLSCCFSEGVAIAEKVRQTGGEGCTRRGKREEVKRSQFVPYEESQSIGDAGEEASALIRTAVTDAVPRDGDARVIICNIISRGDLGVVLFSFFMGGTMDGN